MPVTKQQRIRTLARATIDKKRFTFVVRPASKEQEHKARSKLEVVNANCLTNALNKALAKNPGKKVVTTKFYITNMDLITAKTEGLAKSKQARSTIFVNVYPAGHKNEGDCFFCDAGDKTTQAIFRKGEEIVPNTEDWKKLIDPSGFKGINGANQTPTDKTLKKVKAETNIKVNTKNSAKKEKEIETKTKNIMEAKVKKDVKAAKVAKKAAKKSPAKKVAAKVTAKAVDKKEIKLKNGQKWMAVKDVIKLVEKGANKATNKDDKPLPIGYLQKMADHSKEIIVTIHKVEA